MSDSSSYNFDQLSEQPSCIDSHVILPKLAYETFTSRASLRRASGYAKAGAGENPNALAKGLGIALFANTGVTF